MSYRGEYEGFHSKLASIAKATSPATTPMGRCSSAAPLRFRFEVRVSVVISPALVVVTTSAVTFRSICLGNMLGSGDTLNSGATGDPSNWNRCSLGP